MEEENAKEGMSTSLYRAPMTSGIESILRVICKELEQEGYKKFRCLENIKITVKCWL